ncbi:MAG: SDR family oxidoreductase [Pyrinomonadaceae bacterium]|nr:SDR family oxidoreductase [Pyrinomonadaceae bacterium]
MKKKGLIYGAVGGIGEATARLLADAGWELHLTGRDESAVRALAEEIGASHTTGGLEDEGFFNQVVEDAGDSLDGLVYAIGTINLKPLKRLTVSDFESDFRVNAMGAALAVQSAEKALKNGAADTSSVVLYSSIAATQGFGFHASIGMAKAAVSGLVISLAAELSPEIRVNAIAPSLTDTPLAEPMTRNSQMAKSIADLHPLPRLGRPEEVAALTSFLLSDESGWMTGQTIGIDGGRSTLRVKG